jgi:tetratricopeptide (TPR) repeat protein
LVVILLRKTNLTIVLALLIATAACHSAKAEPESAIATICKTKAAHYKEQCKKFIRAGEKEETEHRLRAAASSFHHAAKLSRKAISLSSENMEFVKLNGDALRRLGRVEFIQSKKWSTDLLALKEDNARKDLDTALAAYDRVLEISPNDAMAHFEKGATLKSYGDLALEYGTNEEASKRYQAALTEYDAALRIIPEMFPAYRLKGLTYLQISKTQERQSSKPGTDTNYQLALASCWEALHQLQKASEIEPDNIEIYRNRASALSCICVIEAVQDMTPDSMVDFKKAVDACAEGLDKAPKDIAALNDKAGLLQSSVTILKRSQSPKSEILRFLQTAVNDYDTIIRLAPKSAFAFIEKGCCLETMADAHEQASDPEAARLNYDNAIRSFSHGLKIRPGNVYALRRMAFAYSKLAKFQAKHSEPQAALETYRKSIRAFEETAPVVWDRWFSQWGMALSLGERGELQETLSMDRAARKSFEQAIRVHEKALKNQPDYGIQDFNSLGKAQRKLAKLQFKMSYHKAALKTFVAAIDSFESAVKAAPESSELWKNKAEALFELAELQYKVSIPDNARANLDRSIAASDEALKIAPQNRAASSIKDAAIALRDKLKSGMPD